MKKGFGILTILGLFTSAFTILIEHIRIDKLEQEIENLSRDIDNERAISKGLLRCQSDLADMVKAQDESIKMTTQTVKQATTELLRNLDLEGIDPNDIDVSINEDLLIQSIENTRQAGVPEEKILHNEKEIDEFFLGESRAGTEMEED